MPRARSGRNWILDWAEILMGLEDTSIEFCLEVLESDRYVDNPKDYVDALDLGFFIKNFWVCVLGSRFVFLLFLFKTHLDLNSYDFYFLIFFI